MPRAKHVAGPHVQRYPAERTGSRCRLYVRQRIMKVAKAVAPWPPQAIFRKRRWEPA